MLGRQWCVQALGANGHYDQAPFAGQTIQDADTQTPMRGCVCYCPEDHTLMTQGVAGTLSGVDLSWYDSQVAALKALSPSTKRVMPSDG